VKQTLQVVALVAIAQASAYIEMVERTNLELTDNFFELTADAIRFIWPIYKSDTAIRDDLPCDSVVRRKQIGAHAEGFDQHETVGLERARRKNKDVRSGDLGESVLMGQPAAEMNPVTDATSPTGAAATVGIAAVADYLERSFEIGRDELQEFIQSFLGFKPSGKDEP